MAEEKYTWTDNPTKSGKAICDTDILNDCLMHLKYDNKGGSGLEVCDIGMALYVDETKGLRRYLNGQIVDINANTQAFLDRLKEIQTTNPDYFTTEDNWQAEALLNIDGCVYKFVLNYADDGETVISVRLPKYPDYVEINAGSLSNSKIPVTSNQTLGSRRISIPCNNKINGTYKVGSQDGSGDVFTYGDFDTSIYWYANTSNIGINKTKLKLRYFIQIATGSETENNIINDIELNNPYSLFDYKYSPFELNNISWLKSNGQWNAKAVYTDAYDKLLKVYNGTETVEGLSVKLSTEAYTNYDFVLNTSDETFRLPLDTIDHPINSTGTLPVKGNGMTVGWTNGTQKFGTSAFYGAYGAMNTGSYGTNIGNTSYGSNNVSVATIGLTTDPTKSGIVADLTSKKANLYLYFYVGETVQNANLIDAGRIGEQIADIKSNRLWVKKYVTNVVVNTSFAKSEALRLDFSSYLPDDGNTYEVLCYILGKSSTAQCPELMISDSINEGTRIFIPDNLYTNSRAGQQFLAIINNSRKATIQATETSGTVYVSMLRFLGYRRLG